MLPAFDGPKNRFGFFGQMVDIKGIQIILRAVAILREQGFTNFKVELNGDNLRYGTPALTKEIEDFFTEENERPFAQRIVHSNGSYQVDQLASRMARVDWSISGLPSGKRLLPSWFRRRGCSAAQSSVPMLGL